MERYVILDDKGNYVVQFLTIVRFDGTSVTKLQTVSKNDIDFIINECSFNSLEAAEAYTDALNLDSKSLGFTIQFKIKKLISAKNITADGNIDNNKTINY